MLRPKPVDANTHPSILRERTLTKLTRQAAVMAAGGQKSRVVHHVRSVSMPGFICCNVQAARPRHVQSVKLRCARSYHVTEQPRFQGHVAVRGPRAGHTITIILIETFLPVRRHSTITKNACIAKSDGQNDSDIDIGEKLLCNASWKQNSSL